MSRVNLVPSLDRELSALKKRVTDLERVLRRTAAAVQVAAAGLTLNLRGQVTSVETDRYYPPPPLSPLAPSGFFASLSAGGPATVELRKNGVAVAVLQPTVGLAYVEISETWTTDDYVTIAVTAWSVGSRGLIAGPV